MLGGGGEDIKSRCGGVRRLLADAVAALQPYTGRTALSWLPFGGLTIDCQQPRPKQSSDSKVHFHTCHTSESRPWPRAVHCCHSMGPGPSSTSCSSSLFCGQHNLWLGVYGFIACVCPSLPRSPSPPCTARCLLIGVSICRATSRHVST